MSFRIPRKKSFNVTLPDALYEAGEFARERLGLTRSEFVAHLYRAYLREAEREQRVIWYREAYQRLPRDIGEDALTAESMRLLGEP